MGRHEEVIEQCEIIREMLSATPTASIGDVRMTTDLCVRRVAEYIYNREVAWKKIINCLLIGDCRLYRDKLEINNASLRAANAKIEITGSTHDGDILITLPKREDHL